MTGLSYWRLDLSDLDLQREWNRISERYGRLSDDELLEISRDGNLTSVANEALAAELKNRGLSISPVLSSDWRSEPPEDMPQDLVEVGRFRFAAEGSLAKAALESSGIKAFLFDEKISTYAGLGVRVSVSREDSKSALEILSQPIPPSFEVEGVGLFEQPRCPRNSLDISFGVAIPSGTVDC